MKERGELKKEVEAVLFAAGRKVSLDELSRLCNAGKDEAEAAIKELKSDYESSQSPLLLTEESDGFKLTVRERYLSLVKEITPHTELNRGMLGTLALVAWKQPVMQSEVIHTRGSNAYEDIRNLVELGFISKDKHGRSFILKPTGKFFEYFDLPSKEAVREVFKDMKDVEPEVQAKIEPGEEEKLGELKVYPSQEKEEVEEGVLGEDSKETLDGLEVFKEAEGGEKEGSEDENGEDEEKPGEDYVPEGVAPEQYAPEYGKENEAEEPMEQYKTKEEPEDGSDDEEGIMKKLADDGGPEEKGEDDAEEEPYEGPSTSKKKRLPRELEEFAGEEEESKEDSQEEGKNE